MVSTHLKSESLIGLNPNHILGPYNHQSEPHMHYKLERENPCCSAVTTLKDVYWPVVPGVAHHAHHMSCLSTNETQHRILEQTILYSIDGLPISRAICLADEFHQFLSLTPAILKISLD